MQIKNRFTDAIIFEYTAESLRATLEAAVEFGANLSEANLIGANLSEANLSEANLSEANLSGANLIGAYLSEANLSEANLSKANLSGANLSKTILDPANIPNAQTDGFLPVPDELGWVYGYRTRKTSAAGLMLQDDRIYGCEVFSTSDDECHPGWYLWPTLEASHKWQSDGEHVQVKSRVIDIHKPANGNKWRSRAIWVLGRAGDRT